jgi:hypothetical protein
MSANSTAKKKKIFLAVFDSKMGNISKACEAVPIDRRTYYNWIEKDEKFKAATEDVVEKLIDHVEDKLKYQINSGDTTAIIFFLKTRAKNRGYVERHDHTLSGGEPPVKYEIVEDFLPRLPKKQEAGD